jgi:4-hydroxybenzoate polyprenyltransferase
VKSLAVLLGDQAWVFLAFLGLLQVGFFAMTALKANLSMIFWVFGLGVWAVNMPWHVWSLDANNRKSGGKIFKANIMLGLYMSVITLVELLVTRVHLGSLVEDGKTVLANLTR